MNPNVLSRLDEITQKHPEQLLYSFLDINGNEVEKYTYEGFAKRIGVIASNLLAQGKFRQGDRMVLAYPAGLEMIAAFFGCIKAGFIPVPAYPPTSNGFQSSLQKIGYIIRDCEAKAILTGKEYYWSFQLNVERSKFTDTDLRKWIPSHIQWINTDTFFSELPVAYPGTGNDVLFLQYTSGSTSDPKGVMVSHSNILYNCTLVSDHLPVCASWLPQYHDMGLIGYYIFCALQGGTTYGFSPVDFIQKPSLWLEVINRYRCTASSAPNFAYEYILQPGKLPSSLLKGLDLSCLKFLMTAAEPVSPEVYETFLEYFKPYGLSPDNYFAAYGLAENKLAVSNYGRQAVHVKKEALKHGFAIPVSCSPDEPDTVKIMSCGTALGDNDIRIVHPQTTSEQPDGEVGEVWIAGQSKCLGYWKKPEQTQQVFFAEISSKAIQPHRYLRTGDLGFRWENELYICGRLKDIIIIRGLNYYPQDVEKLIEASSDKIRKTCTAAFATQEDGREKLVVVAGVKNTKHLPNVQEAADALRNHFGINLSYISFMPARDVPKTSSGKIMREKIKQDWLNGQLPLIETIPLLHSADNPEAGTGKAASAFDEIRSKYALKGYETTKLGEALDSMDLVLLMHDLQEKVAAKGAEKLSQLIDIKFIQELGINELFALGRQLEEASGLAILRLKKMLAGIQDDYRKAEQSLMLSDCTFHGANRTTTHIPAEPATLLTGGTGFLGPFLLRRLLALTTGKIYVLVRSLSEAKAMNRIVSAQKDTFGKNYVPSQDFLQRVVPLCGDLSQQGLGLTTTVYEEMTNLVTDIYHNGALVNYLYTYEKMRDVNVKGTHALVAFALTGTRKVFNHVSTTFIFGWAVRDVLLESSGNNDINLLDFGYSQSKWVSEQIVLDAMKKGLTARIFRPALISPAIDGTGHNFDIAIRLLAFMVKYGIGVQAGNQVSFLPADVVANNIIAISKLESSIDKTFHVTRDTYNTMTDVTDLITRIAGKRFHHFPLTAYVPEVVSRCTREDILFPLLDFLVRSVDKINAMEFKRYDNTTYQTYRNQSPHSLTEPCLYETVSGIVRFLQRNELI